jgi:UDP:flavonoid glycosyltransferase YjiC (YdhE family)
VSVATVPQFDSCSPGSRPANVRPVGASSRRRARRRGSPSWWCPGKRFSQTHRSLEDLYEHTTLPFHLIYVDAGSPAPIRRYLEEASRQRGFQLIRLDRYVGQNEARNLARRRALFSQVLAADVNRLRGELDLPPVSDWSAWLKYPGLNVGIWPDWFATRDPAWPAEVAPVGFVLDNEGERGDLPADLRRSLDAGERLVLITGGTGTFAGAGFYSASIDACLRSGRSAILVTPYDEFVPVSLSESIRRYSHLPLGKLMSQMDVVIHHGGRGTMSCALAAGTPQVVLATGADRPGNAIRLEELGVGKYLPRPAWNADAVAHAVEDLSGSPAVRERCREIAGWIAETDSVAAACSVIEEAGRRGGGAGI